MFGDALVNLGWARERSVDRAVSYFKSAYQYPAQVADILRSDTFEKILRYARKAGAIEIMWANGGRFTDGNSGREFPQWLYQVNLRDSDLSWVLDIPAGYGDSIAIHHAILVNPEFRNAVDSVIQS